MKNYAGFWTRFAGIFIDGLIIGVLPNIVINTGHGTSMNNPLSFLLGLGYSVWMLGTYGATVGMMVLKIKTSLFSFYLNYITLHRVVFLVLRGFWEHLGLPLQNDLHGQNPVILELLYLLI